MHIWHLKFAFSCNRCNFPEILKVFLVEINYMWHNHWWIDQGQSSRQIFYMSNWLARHNMDFRHYKRGEQCAKTRAQAYRIYNSRGSTHTVLVLHIAHFFCIPRSNSCDHCFECKTSQRDIEDFLPIYTKQIFS